MSYELSEKNAGVSVNLPNLSYLGDMGSKSVLEAGFEDEGKFPQKALENAKVGAEPLKEMHD